MVLSNTIMDAYGILTIIFPHFNTENFSYFITVIKNGEGGRVGKDMYPNYQMSLGGRSDEQTMLGINCMRVPAKRVIPVTLKIIEMFKKNKRSGDTLSSWISRIVEGNENSEIKSISEFKKTLTPLTVPPTMQEDKDFYSDYGSSTGYHTVTGKGECAA